jgi:hypothetical protein
MRLLSWCTWSYNDHRLVTYFTECAAGASRHGRDVIGWIHGRVERVASHDLLGLISRALACSSLIYRSLGVDAVMGSTPASPASSLSASYIHKLCSDGLTDLVVRQRAANMRSVTLVLLSNPSNFPAGHSVRRTARLALAIRENEPSS